MSLRRTFTLNEYETTNLELIKDEEEWPNRSKLIHKILRDFIELWKKENPVPAESGEKMDSVLADPEEVKA